MATSPYLGLEGKKFGKWTLLKFKLSDDKNDKWRKFYECRCECGFVDTIRAEYLVKGWSSACKKCKNIQANGYASFKRVFRTYKRQAASRNLSWSLTESEFRLITTSNCHYTGLPPSNICKTGGGEYRYNGIDRINSLEGYNMNNCVACNGEVNRMKANLSYEQFITICQLIGKVTSRTNIKSILKAV